MSRAYSDTIAAMDHQLIAASTRHQWDVILFNADERQLVLHDPNSHRVRLHPLLADFYFQII